MSKKSSGPCIKHKLWGQLKAEAKKAYKIFPVEGRNLFCIKYWSSVSRKYEDIPFFPSDFYVTINDAVESVERLRSERFCYLCEKTLYERRFKKVKNL